MDTGYIFGQHYTTIYIKDNDGRVLLFVCIITSFLFILFLPLVLTLSISAAFLEVSESGIVSFTFSKDKVTAVPVNITVTPLTYQQYSNNTATNNNLPSLSNTTTAPSNPAEGISMSCVYKIIFIIYFRTRF